MIHHSLKIDTARHLLFAARTERAASGRCRSIVLIWLIAKGGN